MRWIIWRCSGTITKAKEMARLSLDIAAAVGERHLHLTAGLCAKQMVLAFRMLYAPAPLTTAHQMGNGFVEIAPNSRESRTWTQHRIQRPTKKKNGYEENHPKRNQQKTRPLSNERVFIRELRVSSQRFAFFFHIAITNETTSKRSQRNQPNEYTEIKTAGQKWLHNTSARLNAASFFFI